MRLRIDRSSGEPPSTQLRRQLANAVRDGRLLPGERLPTVRELAARLAIAPNTVAKVYRELEAVSLVEGRGRRGTFVSERPARAGTDLRDAADRFARRAAGLGVGVEGAVAEVREAFARAGRVGRPSARGRASWKR